VPQLVLISVDDKAVTGVDGLAQFTNVAYREAFSVNPQVS